MSFRHSHRFRWQDKLLVDSVAGFEARLADLRRLEYEAPLLTAEDASARLAVPESFLRQAGRDGRIKVVNVGTYVRFSQAEIDRVKREGVREAMAPSRRLTDLALRRGMIAREHCLVKFVAPFYADRAITCHRVLGRG